MNQFNSNIASTSTATPNGRLLVLTAALVCIPASSNIDAIISEANYAFKLNMYMFDEIQGSARKSLWTLFINWIRGIFK